MKNKASILIVDDNISLCKTMSLILERKGYAVTIAEDGQEAVKEVKEKPFDMIFMDIKMPRLNGVEAYRGIKEIRPEAIVMMMTGFAVEDLVQEALKEGAYGIMYKPLDPEKIVTLIEEVRAARRGALILVVDDDPGFCTTLRGILDNRGHKAGIAHTGEEAIAMVRERDYEVIFIDMKLPTINGLETYLAIKEIRPQVVAIMMTGYRQEMADLVEEALKNSACTCLYKPFDMPEVLSLVEEICRRRTKA